MLSRLGAAVTRVDWPIGFARLATANGMWKRSLGMETGRSPVVSLNEMGPTATYESYR